MFKFETVWNIHIKSEYFEMAEYNILHEVMFAQNNLRPLWFT